MKEIPQDLMWQTQLIDMTGSEYCMTHNTEYLNDIKIVCHAHERHYEKVDVDEHPALYDDYVVDADADDDKLESVDSVDSVVAHDDDDAEMDEMIEDIGLGVGSSVSGILASAIGAFIYRRVVSY